MNPYTAKIEALVEGTIPQLEITQEEFMGFREAWLGHPKRQEIVGEAGLNGQIIYRKSESKEAESENAEKK